MICTQERPDRHAELKFRLLAEAIPQLVWTARADGSCDYVNQRWCEYTGQSPAEAHGRGWLDCLHPEDRDRCLERWVSASGDAGTFATEYRLQRADGAYRWFLSRAEALRDDNGRTVHWFGTATDIDDQKRAEEAGRHEVDHYRRIVESAQDGIWEVDASGTTVYVNGRMGAMLGYGPAEMIGRPFFDFAAAADVPAARARFESHLAGVSETFEWRWPRRDGSEVWTLASCNPITDAGGQFRGAVGIFTDLTERYKAEERLRESERRLSLALRASRDCLWDWDLRTDRVFFCDRWKELRGYAPHEVGDDSTVWSGGIHSEDRDRVMRAVRDHLDGRTPDFKEEYRVRCKDGSYKWILDRGEAVRDDAGRPVQMTGFETDITDRKRLEEALQEADRRKDDFLAMVAHEIRGPLGPIRNSVEILHLANLREPPLVRAQETIDRQVTHIVRLVEDLLDLSRVRQGKVQLRKQRCDLARVVCQTAEDYHGTFRADGLWLDVHVPDSPVWVDGDPTRLAQVLNNTLQNAAKFTDRGGVVTVSLDTESSADAATLRIRDTGIGMDSEALRLVFEPFSQVEQSRDRSRGGLGLGLSLVKGLVELHGGAVSAASEGPGRGTEVVIRLPLASGATPLSGA